MYFRFVKGEEILFHFDFSVQQKCMCREEVNHSCWAGWMKIFELLCNTKDME